MSQWRNLLLREKAYRWLIHISFLLWHSSPASFMDSFIWAAWKPELYLFHLYIPRCSTLCSWWEWSQCDPEGGRRSTAVCQWLLMGSFQPWVLKGESFQSAWLHLYMLEFLMNLKTGAISLKMDEHLAHVLFAQAGLLIDLHISQQLASCFAVSSSFCTFMATCSPIHIAAPLGNQSGTCTLNLLLCWIFSKTEYFPSSH